MAAANTDTLDRVTDSTTGRPVLTQLANPGKAIAAPSITAIDTTNWTTTTGIHFSLYNLTSAGVKDPTTQTDWKGVVSGNTISNLVLTGGTDRAYTAGAILDPTPTARYAKDVYDNVISHANQDGTLKSAAVLAALNIGASGLNGFLPLGYTPGTVVYNGNRNYSLSFSGVDLTVTGLALLANGMRLRTTRTVAAPTQCSLLTAGSSQYYSRASGSLTGMTFTGSHTTMAWIKIVAYPAAGSQIIGRTDNGTGGFSLGIDSNGRVRAFYGASSNFTDFFSTQAIPVSKWIHIASSVNAAAKTIVMLIDGVVVPTTSVLTAATTVAQTSNLELGRLGTNYISVMIAQAAIFSTNVATATLQGYISQGLLGTETSLVSAYSFNGNANDLNTTNANNLTANNGVAATTADSPFGGQANGTISSTLDYAIISSATFSTNTTVLVQVAEGCTIPTSGGVTSVVYSSNKVPFGMPVQKEKWRLESRYTVTTEGAVGAGAITNWMSAQLQVPAGFFDLLFRGNIHVTSTTNQTGQVTSSLGLTAANATPISPLLTDDNYTLATGATATGIITRQTAADAVAFSSMTTVYANLQTELATTNGWYSFASGRDAVLVIQAENSLL